MKKNPPIRKANMFLTGEEALLWQKITKDVRPLSGQRKNQKPASSKAAPMSATLPQSASVLKSAAAAANKAKQAFPNQPPLVADWRTAKNLKNGKIAVEARLDLHGMTQAEAHKALSSFICASREMGRRCVLVITGKGRSLALDGVLRSMAPQWLGQPAIRGQIISFSQAASHDGGEGALYVLLKKKR